MAVPSTMSDLSTTASSNSPAGSENPISTDDFHRAIQAILRHTNAKGVDIASASSIDLGAATGEFVDITDTNTITALGTIAAGIVRTVRFTDALILTHNATSLILPTSANITTVAGDVAMFRSLGSGNWKCVGYIRQDGSALKPIQVTSQTAVTAATDDYLLISDTSDSNANKKVLVSDIKPVAATTSVAGVVEKATQAEAIAFTADKFIDGELLQQAFNTDGSAPLFAFRAWVSFNGTGTVAIRDSGNVSSITDNGTGDYTMNYTTAMPDANYGYGGFGRNFSASLSTAGGAISTTQLRCIYRNTAGTNTDDENAVMFAMR